MCGGGVTTINIRKGQGNIIIITAMHRNGQQKELLVRGRYWQVESLMMFTMTCVGVLQTIVALY